MCTAGAGTAIYSARKMGVAVYECIPCSATPQRKTGWDGIRKRLCQVLRSTVDAVPQHSSNRTL